MFSGDSYHSPFFTWLRAANSWQLVYLLLASNAHDKGDYPHFIPKVLGVCLQRAIQGVKEAAYSQTALGWFKERPPAESTSGTPLFIPVLIELIADGLSVPPAVLAGRCLENSKRFFKVTAGPKKPETKAGWGWGWGQAKFFLSYVTSLTIMYSALRSVPYLYNWFTNVTNADTDRP